MVGQVERGGLPQRDGPGGGEKLRHKLGAEIAVFPVEGEAQQAERHPDIAVAVVRPAGGHGPQTGLRQPVGPVGHRDPVAAAGGDAAAAELVGGLLREAAEGEAVKPSVALQADGGVGEPPPAEQGQQAGEAAGVFGEQYAQVFHRTDILFWRTLQDACYHTTPAAGRQAFAAGLAGNPCKTRTFLTVERGNRPKALQFCPRCRMVRAALQDKTLPQRMVQHGKQEDLRRVYLPPPEGAGAHPAGIRRQALRH